MDTSDSILSQTSKFDPNPLMLILYHPTHSATIPCGMHQLQIYIPFDPAKSIHTFPDQYESFLPEKQVLFEKGFPPPLQRAGPGAFHF